MLWYRCLVISVVVTNEIVRAFPRGAPGMVCDSISPDPGPAGHGVDPQDPSIFPYTVECYRSKENEVTMSLTAVDVNFRGLFAQLRDGDVLTGEFIDIPDPYQVRCFKQGVTHTEPSDKTFAEFRVNVTASAIRIRPLDCVFTVVQEKQNYWVENRTRIDRSRPLTTAPAPTPTPSPRPSRPTPQPAGRRGRRGRQRQNRRRQRRRRRRNRPRRGQRQ